MTYTMLKKKSYTVIYWGKNVQLQRFGKEIIGRRLTQTKSPIPPPPLPPPKIHTCSSCDGSQVSGFNKYADKDTNGSGRESSKECSVSFLRTNENVSL